MSYRTLDLQELASEFEALEDLEPEERDEDDRERYAELKELDDEIGGLSYIAENEGVAIAEYDFEEYAQQLAEDIGAISTEHQWPLYCIDWEHAARELQHDYMGFSFEGTDYLVRSC